MCKTHKHTHTQAHTNAHELERQSNKARFFYQLCAMNYMQLNFHKICANIWFYNRLHLHQQSRISQTKNANSPQSSSCMCVRLCVSQCLRGARHSYATVSLSSAIHCAHRGRLNEIKALTPVTREARKSSSILQITYLHANI